MNTMRGGSEHLQPSERPADAHCCCPGWHHQGGHFCFPADACGDADTKATSSANDSAVQASADDLIHACADTCAYADSNATPSANDSAVKTSADEYKIM